VSSAGAPLQPADPPWVATGKALRLVCEMARAELNDRGQVGEATWALGFELLDVLIAQLPCTPSQPR
jgi:hypothetical protein